MDGEERTTWWRRTEHLTMISLGVAFVLCVLPLLAPHGARAFGLPAGELVAMVVVPMLAATLIFLHAGTQRRLDRKHRGNTG